MKTLRKRPFDAKQVVPGFAKRTQFHRQARSHRARSVEFIDENGGGRGVRGYESDFRQGRTSALGGARRRVEPAPTARTVVGKMAKATEKEIMVTAQRG